MTTTAPTTAPTTTPDPAPDLAADIRLTAASVSVTVRGELDLFTAPRLAATLGRVLDEGSATVRVHLDQVSFVDTAGARVLVAAAAAQDAGGGVLEVVADTPRARRLLDVCGLSAVLCAPLPSSADAVLAAD